MKLILWWFLFVGALFALDNNAILKRADSALATKKHDMIARAYDDYKELYLKSVLEDNISLKSSALKGIVASGKFLKIDISNYENELRLLPSSGTPSVQHESKSAAKTPQISSLNRLSRTKWSGDKLMLSFDQSLDIEKINHFTLYDDAKRRYRYIFDISSAMLTSSQNLHKAHIDTIKIAQFTTDTLRLVIENSSKIYPEFQVNGSTLEVSILTKSPLELKKDEPEKSEPQEAVVEQKQPVFIPSETAIDKNKIIVIDAGHGGDDPGAIGYNRIREKDVVFAIATELRRILKARGYNVFMTREGDEYVKLPTRTRFANEKKAHLFLSIHANAVDNKGAGDASGIESYFLSPSRSTRAKNVAAKENSADMTDMSMSGKDVVLSFVNKHNIDASHKLAIDLQKGICSEAKKQSSAAKDIGVKEGPFWVLVGAQMPSVLVEVGFVTHPVEGSKLAEDEYREALAKGLADGVDRYFANCGV